MEKYFTESQYDEILDELTYRVESGELTLEEAQVISERAYGYVTESVTDVIILAASAALLLAPAIIALVNYIRTCKGLKKDPELAELGKKASSLKSDIKRGKATLERIYDSLSSEAEKYNTIAKTLGTPTIKVEHITKIPVQGVDEAGNAVTKYIDQTTSREEQNRNYDPEKAKKAEMHLKTIEKKMQEYANAYEFLQSKINELGAVEARVLRLARKAPASEEDKAGIQSKIDKVKEEYDTCMDYVKQIK